MGKDPSKTKRCTECNRLVDAATMRPMSRNPDGGDIRRVCADCFARVTAQRNAARNKGAA